MKKFTQRRWRAMARHQRKGFADPRYLKQGIRGGRHYPLAEVWGPSNLIPKKARLEDLED